MYVWARGVTIAGSNVGVIIHCLHTTPTLHNTIAHYTYITQYYCTLHLHFTILLHTPPALHNTIAHYTYITQYYCTLHLHYTILLHTTPTLHNTIAHYTYITQYYCTLHLHYTILLHTTPTLHNTIEILLLYYYAGPTVINSLTELEELVNGRGPDVRMRRAQQDVDDKVLHTGKGVEDVEQ